MLKNLAEYYMKLGTIPPQFLKTDTSLAKLCFDLGLPYAASYEEIQRAKEKKKC